MAAAQQYHSFLASLDDTQLVQHIRGLSQGAETSTPKHVSSDPFDDDLDDVLLQIPGKDGGSSSDSDVGEMHRFGEYDVYFRNKHQKQQKADNSFLEWDLRRRREANAAETLHTPIFQGCTVFVNGHTVPAMNEIHRVVVLYGGKFINYLPNKSAATHIVCDRLTPRKRIQFRACRVVKAQWVADSVARGELLDWKQYRLIDLVDYNQGRLELEERPEEIEFANRQFNKEEFEFDEFDDLVGTNESLVAADEDTGLIDIQQERVASAKSTMMDAKHPDFIPHFFSNSRLHHLSSWKADLRLKFLKRIMKSKPEPALSNPANGSIVFHIDFDCFFATASCQNHPEIDINKDPVAVSHGGNTSDVASCNYPARELGVRNGMWVRSAKRLCPDLKIIDYDFDLYEKLASETYNYLISKGEMIDTLLPVAVDEVLLDMSSHFSNSADLTKDVEDVAETFRRDIFTLTKCTVSVGASTNVLLAKLALRQAKPNGKLFVHHNVESFLDSLKVKDLPGVGYSLIEKLGIEFQLTKEPKILELRQLPKGRLMNVFGPKTGEKLFNYARGIDATSLKIDAKTTPELFGRKTVSVDINFGIRFDEYDQLETFLMRLAEELTKRLKSLNLVGSQISIRLARRSANAPVDPPKYLGMGQCDFYTKSARLGVATNDAKVMGAEMKTLARILGVPILDLRGVAVTVSKLQDSDSFQKSKQMKLSFNKPKKRDKAFEQLVDTSNFKDPIGSQNVDWEVFNELPWDIRRELKSELTRRGMLPDNTSPSKLAKGQKAYLQQLLPSSGGTTRFVRVLESPTKSPSKRQRATSKSVAPTKKVDVGDESKISIDSSVLEELPSSIRNEVLEHETFKKRLMALQNKPSNETVQVQPKRHEFVIDEEFLSNKGYLQSEPLFFDQEYSLEQIKQQLSGWVATSLDQGGPHEDDVTIFVDYLKALTNLGKLNKCLGLIRCLRQELEFVAASYSLATNYSQVIDEALDDWQQVMKNKLEPVVDEFAHIHGVEIIH